LTKTFEIVEKISTATAIANAKATKGTEDSALVPVLGPDGKAMLVTRRQANEAANAGTPYTPAPRSTTAGQIAQTLANRVYNNIEGASNDLVNLANSPAIASSPVFSGIINSDPTTIPGSLQALAVRKITKPEQRAFDQLSQQIGLALSRLEAQGLASGSTVAQVKGFDSLRPKAGDNALNMALYLAKVRQEIETGVRTHSTMHGANTEQKQFAQERLREVQQAIPFTVKEVLDVMRKNNADLSSSMQKLLMQPGIATGLKGVQTSTSTQSMSGESENKRKAREAISRGANRESVIQRLRENGEDISGL
jgi:hypothetical protein